MLKLSPTIAIVASTPAARRNAISTRALSAALWASVVSTIRDISGTRMPGRKRPSAGIARPTRSTASRTDGAAVPRRPEKRRVLEDERRMLGDAMPAAPRATDVSLDLDADVS